MTYTTYAKALILLVLVASVPAVGMEPQENEYKGEQFARLGHNVAIGSVTGIVEVSVNQPLICIKNMLQQGKGISLNPRVLYRGFWINVACMAPTTAAQIATNKALEEIVQGTDTISVTGRAYVAGGLSALLSSPTELVVLHQQNTGKNAFHVVKNLVAEKGISVMRRGMLAKSGRDSLFGGGFLSAYPAMEKKIREHIDSTPVAVGGAGLIVGSGIAVASHPWDTLSTCMQADYKKQHAKTTWQAAQLIYKKDGWKGFFKGVTPRATRVVLAIPLMSKVQQYLSNISDKTAKEKQ